MVRRKGFAWRPVVFLGLSFAVGAGSVVAWSVVREARPWAAVGFTMCGQLVGAVITYDDGAVRAWSADQIPEEAVGLAESIPQERKGVIEMAPVCARPQGA